MQAGNVTLTYNGLGDLVTRSEGGAANRFYYNHAIGLKPIVAERDDTTGQFLRYYVWTPNGRLLYTIDAADRNKVYFFHFDRTGSTLALTDASGNVTDSFAYSPYGQLLGHDGTSEQPFTFRRSMGCAARGRYWNTLSDARPLLRRENSQVSFTGFRLARAE